MPRGMTEPALALVDFSSIAVGIEAADAMVKRAEIDVIRAGTVQPGRYLVLIGGTVADVQTAVEIGVEVLARPDLLVRQVVIPQLHAEMWENVSDATRFSTRVREGLR